MLLHYARQHPHRAVAVVIGVPPLALFQIGMDGAAVAFAGSQVGGGGILLLDDGTPLVAPGRVRRLDPVAGNSSLRLPLTVSSRPYSPRAAGGEVCPSVGADQHLPGFASTFQPDGVGDGRAGELERRGLPLGTGLGLKVAG
jgi:hypothetical protein